MSGSSSSEDDPKTPRMSLGPVEDNPRSSRVTSPATSTPGSQTPRMSLGPVEDNSRGSRVTTSPTTSTPGSSPTGSYSSGLKDSDLQSSDESIIETSATGKGSYVDINMGTTGKGREMEEVEIIEVIEVTLAEKSVKKVSAQDVEDASCETTLEYTDLQGSGAMSCVAQRTRSHTEEMRKDNLSQLVEGFSLNDTSMENSFEIIQHAAADSLSLPRYNKEGLDKDSLKTLCDYLKIIDSSMDKVKKIEEPYEQEKLVRIYEGKTAEIARKNEEMKPLQEGKEEAEGLEKEIEEIKNATFVMEEPQYTSALQEVIKALEILVGIDFSLASAKQMEKIIRMILSICMDYNIQVQNIQDTLVSMAKFIRELLV